MLPCVVSTVQCKPAPPLSFRPCDTNTLPLCHFDRSAKNEREAEKSILIKCRSCNYYPHEISPRTRYARLVEMTGDFRLRLRSSAKAYRSRRAEDVTPYRIIEQFLYIVGDAAHCVPHYLLLSFLPHNYITNSDCSDNDVCTACHFSMRLVTKYEYIPSVITVSNHHFM